MQKNQELHPDYSPLFRRIELASAIGFFVLTLTHLKRIIASNQLNETEFFFSIFAGYIGSDFTSGLVHWAADTWGHTGWPLLGKTLIRPFREHHQDPQAMVHHDFLEAAGSHCLISLPVLILAFFINANTLVGAVACLWLISLTAWTIFTAFTHKWAHQNKPPRMVQSLQRLHLILNPEHHQRHHTKPFTQSYCITSGWLNSGLDRLRFFRLCERLISKLTGAIPRQDGLEPRPKPSASRKNCT